ncbi:TraR/DksA C4-type zinc finger protein [Sphingopyxis macrogoltabida]|uniref:Conjugal transfer protein TraR n=1 Tax=Sphingopyxis macrogoltabida TaxID=33050 RepID=A0AAC9FGR8_SPHMC|nr:hypothetical protein [Sphingopyxis macrogoltabida]ALJ15329.1 hypothetical protein LH19_20840 [Sphingopyxis macrogoltabida]AMU91580.1 hypothetical protein ATM17_21430 [Sphingopyxis macrogoltabida]
MADDIDRANELADEHLNHSLRAARAAAVTATSAGVPGECEECGEDMPRLIDGRCGYCRDGRGPRSRT